MSENTDRVRRRFDTLFNDEGLTNVKFFVVRSEDSTTEDFVSAVEGFESTIAAGDVRLVETVDSDAVLRNFNDSF